MSQNQPSAPASSSARSGSVFESQSSAARRSSWSSSSRADHSASASNAALVRLLGERARRTRACRVPELVGLLADSTSCSSAYSRIVSSMRKRSSPIGFRRLSRRAQRGSSSSASQTSSAASSGKRSREDRERARRDAGSRRRAGRSSTRSSRAACAGAPGASRAPPVRSGKAASSRASSASGARSFVRAAASSTASGRPSRRRQIASTVASGSSSRPTERARSTKSAPRRPEGSGSSAVLALAGHVQRRPARDQHAQALADVASSVADCRARRRAGARSCPEGRGAPGRGGSPPRSSGAPSACATSEWQELRIRAGLRAATQKTPSRRVPTSSAATCSASRVLPVPPGPVSVSRRVPSQSSATSSSSSLSRPMSGLAATGQVRGVERPQRREVAVAELVEALRLGQVLEPVLSEVTDSRGGASRRPRVVLGEDDLPAVCGGGDPRRAVDVDADVALVASRSARPCGAPCGRGSGRRSSAVRASAAAATASAALGNATKNASPCVSTSTPECRANASRRARRWSASRSAYAAPCSWRSRVEPSTSVKRKVTVPLGSSRRAHDRRILRTGGRRRLRLSVMQPEEYRQASLRAWEVMAPGWERWRVHLGEAVAPVHDWLIRELAPRPGERCARAR